MFKMSSKTSDLVGSHRAWYLVFEFSPSGIAGE